MVSILNFDRIGLELKVCYDNFNIRNHSTADDPSYFVYNKTFLYICNVF
jgi:hypothetical protein